MGGVGEGPRRFSLGLGTGAHGRGDVLRCEHERRWRRGDRDDDRRSPRKRGLLFIRPTLALSAATISKMPVKPPAPPRLTAPVSPFQTPETLIEYDAVA